MPDALRYHLDDLRRFAASLCVGVGLAPARATAFATQLLWFDTAGVGASGIRTLPLWLDRISSGEVDPSAEGTVKGEALATAVLDGQNGLPPLILARAGGLAVEKSRDSGVGLIQVTNLGHAGPGAGVVGQMAIGPVLGAFLGPGPEWGLALPTHAGLPALFDSALDPPDGTPRPRKPARAAKPTPLESWLPWARVLAPEGTLLVAAIAVNALEPLERFHERVASTLSSVADGQGRLLPKTWEGRRREALENGVEVTTEARDRFSDWGNRLGVALPPPTTPAPPFSRTASGAT